MIGILFSSCNSDDDAGNGDQNNPLTESLVELGIKYGPEDKQFLDLYKAR